MAGHSKWANIQHRKKAQDARRGKIFTRLIRELTIAAREGGGDPSANPRLRRAMDKASAANMAKENIMRAVKRGSAGAEKDGFETATYEGYGPGGIAIMLECATDNRNRTVAEVRHAFTRGGGNLGETGSVNYLFQRRGVIHCRADDEEKLLAAALEANAEDVSEEGGRFIVTVAPDDLFSACDALRAANVEVVDSGHEMLPGTQIEVESGIAEKVVRILDILEDLDDVQKVYTNAVFPDDDPGG